ncbi:hypothetical protein L1987_73171 [Smallanthus sonchifolius]|uniref:Uncharacterized protein n=1 Tax=Smallanthus sonchifolius TaxID=185202 RepID=A0ACB9A114_9ASTR|nr:hypothetical protein L1987_73171 [Smallanthus sonchifolius]
MDLYADNLVPWLDFHTSTVASGTVSASATTTMDALVPSSTTQPHALLSGRAACSTRVGSCSSDRSGFVRGGAAVAAVNDWSSCKEQSVSGSETFGMESSRQLTVETTERELGVKGFTSTSMGSPEDTITGKRSFKSMSPDEHDSVGHSRPQRRDKISEKMKTLQKLVPNANKTDKASMLDEVIEYLKQLQAQIHMMGRMNMPPMMMPLAMPQQLQMAMMNQMGLGIGMGMAMPGVMDLNAIGGSHPNITGMPPVIHPPTFMPPMMASWDMQTTGDRVQNHNDPMTAFLASQSHILLLFADALGVDPSFFGSASPMRKPHDSTLQEGRGQEQCWLYTLTLTKEFIWFFAYFKTESGSSFLGSPLRLISEPTKELIPQGERVVQDFNIKKESQGSKRALRVETELKLLELLFGNM